MSNESSISVLKPEHDIQIIANHIREGRFQRSLALLTAATSLVSGLEVAYEHYRGSYSRRVMYTPVILSAILGAAGIAAFFSRRAIMAVSLFLLLSIGFRSWNAARTDAVSRFWSPILDQKVPTIISLGGVVFSPSSHTGTEVASDPTDGNPYLSFENGLAMGRVAALLNARGGSYRVQAADYTTMAQIREDPTVLVGAYNNQWTYRLAEPWRFHFAPHPDERIVDAQNPKRSWARDRSKPFGNSPDYALVARFRNPSTDSIVVMIAGLQRFGTDAASQFATSTNLLEDFDHRVGGNWRNKNIEVVLRVDVANGRTGAPIIVAIHIW